MNAGLGVGIFGSVCFHAFIFCLAPVIQTPNYEVSVAPHSMEVSLLTVSSEQKGFQENWQSDHKIKDQSSLTGDVRIQNLNRETDRDRQVQTKQEELVSRIQGVFRQAEVIQSVNRAPVYPRVARQNGYEGTVILQVRVSPEGRAKIIRMVQSSGYLVLDESARDTIKGWHFRPARQFGVTVESDIRIPVHFRLRE